jgi:hypothetical protein
MRHVFISYRHESEEHAHEVRHLADRLTEAGLPVELDQSFLEDHPGGPDGGWPKWCCDRAVKSECVLVVASPGWFAAYGQEGEPGVGLGAAAEARIFRQAFYNQKGVNPRVRFVLLNTSGVCEFPLDLDAWHKFQPSRGQDDFDQVVAWIRQKLSMQPVGAQKERRVYLAECLIRTNDGSDLREGLAEELGAQGWEVLPGEPYPDSTYAQEVVADLERSVAFIQILQPHRWKGADRDYLQYEKALKVGLKCIRFRDPDMDMSKVLDETHRDFLTSDSSVCARQFDQFRKEAIARLEELWGRLHEPPPPPPIPGGPRLVRVIVRSTDPEALWGRVFPWVDEEPGLIHDRMTNYESGQLPLATKHRIKPCHGFLVVCDASALEKAALSPDRPLEECQNIQLGIKEPERWPPVGLVYWPPPAVGWARLVNFKPNKFTRALGDEGVVGLKEFFSAVREVAL